MRVLFASSSFVSIPIIDFLLEQRGMLEREYGIEFLGIISNPNARSGRGLSEASNVIVEKFADQLPIFQPATHDELKNILTELNPDLVITCAYGRLIKRESLEIPQFGWLNLHFSLLPRWRGAAPVQWGLLSGDQEFGFTIFKLDEGMDTGPVIIQRKVSIENEAIRDEVLLSISRAAIAPLFDVIKDIEHANFVKQSSDGVTLAPKISKEMGEIDWSKSSQEIFNLYRALTPDPGVFTHLGEVRLAITKMSVDLSSLSQVDLSEKISLMKPGEFIHPSKSTLIGVVKTSEGCLQIEEVKPAGKKAMSFGDFARGIRLTPQEIRRFS
jgi:methionyl-tRNA formyltransferase